MLVGCAVVAFLLIGSAGAGAESAGIEVDVRASSLLGSDFRVNGPSGTDIDRNPAVAWNKAANQYLVVWQARRNSVDCIYGRRVGADGKRLGGDFRISGCNHGSGAYYSAVAWNQTARQYLVVWVGGSGLYGRRVTGNGEPVGTSFGISGAGAGSPVVVWNQKANEYLVVWPDARNSETRDLDIWGQRLSGDGTPIGIGFRISGPNATARDWNPAVAWNKTDNQYLVVWQDNRNSPTLPTDRWDIYGRRVGADGKPVGVELRISAPNVISNKWLPAVAWSGAANQYLVVWQDNRNYPTTLNDIYGRRVGADGKPVGNDFNISGPDAYNPNSDAAVVWNWTTREYLVVWTDQRDYLDRGRDIYGRRLGAGAAPVGAGFRISGINATSNEIESALAWNQTANEYLVVWTDGRNYETREMDIWGRRVAG
jgi:hypothetical protein